MKNYEIKRQGDVQWIEFKHFAKYDIIHFSTLRTGGISSEPQKSLNMGFTEFDNPKNVIQNRQIIANIFDIPIESMIFAEQTHSNNIQIITKSDLGRGTFTEDDEFKDVDGFVTNEKGLCPIAQSADCVPIILYEPIAHVAAAIHSGWKGTSKKIAAKAVQKMQSMGAKPSQIIAGIGPSAGVCCYEIKDDVKNIFYEQFGNQTEKFIQTRNNKMFLDLWTANETLLQDCGLLAENIVIADICTIDNPEMFFSARYNKGKTGRMATGIMLL